MSIAPGINQGTNKALQLAIDEFICSLPAAEQAAFKQQATALNDQTTILASVKAYDDAHKNSSRFRPKTKVISRFLDLLTKCMSGLATAIQVDPTPAAIIVGAAQILVTLATEFTTFFDRLSEMLDRLNDYLHPLARYATVAENEGGATDLIIQTLIPIYSELLRFLRDARLVFVDYRGARRKSSSLRVFYRVMWEPFEVTFGDTERRFQHHLNVLQHATGAVSLDLQVMHQRQAEVAEREAFLNWISRDNFEHEQERIWEKRFPGTCEWFLRKNKVREWMQSNHSRILWCVGKPAYCILTKTTRPRSYIIEHIWTKVGLDKDIGIGILYYSYDRPELVDLPRVLSALLKQLCQRKSTVPEELLQCKRNSLMPSFLTLQRLFTSVIKSFKETFIVIDALDECPGEARYSILGFLAQLVSTTGCTRILLMSRDEPGIADILEGYPKLAVDEQDVADDIRLYVRGEIKRLRAGYQGKKLYVQSDLLEEEIETKLVNNADGIKARKDKIVRSALSVLPRGLDITYRRIVLRIEEQEEYMRELAQRTFQWILYAKAQPLDFTTFQEALATPTSQQLRSRQELDLDSEEAILEACAGLVIRDDTKLRLIHHSVQEFLLQTPQLTSAGSAESTFATTLRDSQAAHCTLGLACLSYLHLDVLGEGLCDDFMQLYVRLKSHPFLLYSAQNYDHHLSLLHGSIPDNVMDLFVAVLNQDEDALKAILQVRMVTLRDDNLLEDCQADFQPSFQSLNARVLLLNTQLWTEPWVHTRWNHLPLPLCSLHLIAARGSLDVVRHLLQMGCDINEPDDTGATALYYASHQGHLNLVTWLLSQNACPQQEGGHFGSALQAAASAGHLTVVQQLVSKGNVDINCYNGYYGHALQAAAAGGYNSVVGWLIDHGAEVNAPGGIHGNALIAAAFKGHLSVLEQLVQAGAEYRGDCGGPSGSALHAAASGDRVDVAMWLLQHGVDVNLNAGLRGTALQEASRAGHKAVVEVLLAKGAVVNSSVGFHGAALQAAVRSGKREIVELLVQRGADINAQSGEHGSALHAAAYGGDIVMVQWLLGKGADVNLVGGRYHSVLQVAAARGNLELVELLLRKGADINHQGGYHGTALMAAKDRGHEPVVKLLQKAQNGHKL
ncbi:unnamed protein product [Penicillium viridicatum]